jgi:hypothetical protein
MSFHEHSLGENVVTVCRSSGVLPGLLTTEKSIFLRISCRLDILQRVFLPRRSTGAWGGTGLRIGWFDRKAHGLQLLRRIPLPQCFKFELQFDAADPSIPRDVIDKSLKLPDRLL